MKTIEVYWDRFGVKNGRVGCYRARLRENNAIHDAGSTPDQAIRNFLRTAKSLGESDNIEHYQIVQN